MKLLANNLIQKRKRLLGFSLEEVVVSVSIIGITTTASISGYLTAAKRTDWSTRHAAAGKLAIQKLEQTRAARWDAAAANLDDLRESTFPPVKQNLELPQKDGEPICATVRTTIRLVSSNPPLKMVRVDCEWASFDGRAFTNSLVTYRSPSQ